MNDEARNVGERENAKKQSMARAWLAWSTSGVERRLAISCSLRRITLYLFSSIHLASFCSIHSSMHLG